MPAVYGTAGDISTRRLLTCLQRLPRQKLAAAAHRTFGNFREFAGFLTWKKRGHFVGIDSGTMGWLADTIEIANFRLAENTVMHKG